MINIQVQIKNPYFSRHVLYFIYMYVFDHARGILSVSEKKYCEFLLNELM